jgi:uncharacterized repeat protein (TIGR03803 family)
MFRVKSSAARSLCFVISRIGLATLLLSLVVLALPVQAQTFSVIHEFQGPEGWGPQSGLTLDAAGNLWGTTYYATNQQGTVYRMKPSGSGWLFNTLYYFNAYDAPQNGYFLESGVVFGPGGALYGTTSAGGANQWCLGGCGVFYALRPSQTPCHSTLCLWTESVPYRFTGEFGAVFPGRGNLLFDSAGNIYGTTTQGGDYGNGAVYELTKSNGVWIGSVIHSFHGGAADGSYPVGGLVVDSAGNLYGTTASGGPGCQGAGCGIVFELSRSGAGWIESVIHQFQGPEGARPYATLTLGPSGEIYGSTTGGGSNNMGVIFEMSPSGGSWSYSVLYQFQGAILYGGPYGPLVLDAAGDLYGTAIEDGAYGFGSVFKLTHGNGGWNYTSLHDFTQLSDGAYPFGGPALDSHGNLYGTAAGGGTGTCGGGDCGTVWEITP